MGLSSGFLRPSLEETLAFNYLKSVRKEEEADFLEPYQIWFLLFFFCLVFVFPVYLSFVIFFGFD